MRWMSCDRIKYETALMTARRSVIGVPSGSANTSSIDSRTHGFFSKLSSVRSRTLQPCFLHSSRKSFPLKKLATHRMVGGAVSLVGGIEGALASELIRG